MRAVRPRLRWRTATAFALLALVLSVALAIITYELARRVLLDQRQDLAVRQAVVNAGVVRSALTDPQRDIRELLVSLDGSSSARPLLHVDGQWFAATVEASEESVPESLRQLVTDGTPGVQRTRIGGVPYLSIGVPMRAVDALYFELAPLTELQSTLDTFTRALAVAALITTVAGAAAGWWVSGRVMKPLGDVAEAARAISQGDLQTRLPENDPDLTPLTEAFNDMAEALESRIERESRFTSDVSHELRTPLTAITAAVEMARRSESPERTSLALDLVSSRVEHLRALVLDLLEIARFDVGAVELDLQPTDVTTVARQSAASAGVPERVVVSEVDDDELYLLDRRRIERVMANLVVNAVQYADGPTLIHLEERAGRLLLTVEDAGPGITPDERAAVFGRFHRGRAANGPGSPAGTGLGLALVEEHVRLHGGTVSVDSSSCGGARFVVDVPALKP